ncbi:uncharacterized protein BCR38DRAFT_413202 [Pseudomassariella vexata]|uniref:Polynucleotide 5'-hydroxyl-kinase GRC3 n=1 Tax=Pseudomassariella vexata TaxID=1141098 RepID=A0A1Y2DI27_9PEZI|nr:uncharacterized protein BCR38DRAFT_413202 [Pseudomassariella vexata]ORY58887.1 hypothetical protein BCR38DRAFT_413202 [Pseudomassariella vexata]
MASNKRRKLDTAEPPQVMSAFARLKKRAQTSAANQEEDRQPSTPGFHEENATVIPTNDDKPEKAVRVRRKKTKTLEKADQDKSVRSKDQETNLSNVANVDEPTEPAGKVNDINLHAPDKPAVQTPFAPLSTFKRTKSNLQKKSGGKLQLKLSSGERLVILGSYGLRVIIGDVTICGAVLRPSEKIHWIHAPHCHALPVIRCPDEAVLELENHPDVDDLRKLGNLSPHFQRLWNEESSPEAQRKREKSTSTFEILFTSDDRPKRAIFNALISPPEWNREIERLVVASRSKAISVMVTGPKSSGKSTFGKILTNQLVTDSTKNRHSVGVAVLDLDPGQPEHCVPGQITLVHVTEPLLGPSFCRPIPSSSTRMIRSHTLASVSPASDPQLYCAAAIDLLTHYRNRLSACPLVVNMPGWIQGTGLDLITTLIGGLRPTEVMFMSQTGPVEVIEGLEEACRASSLVRLPSQSCQYTTRTAADLRTMQLMSYFHAEANTNRGQVQWNSDPLTTIPPWMVNYSGLHPGILGVLCYGYQAPPELLAEAINGTIVAVVEVERALAFRGARYDEMEGTFDSAEADESASDMQMDLDDSHDLSKLATATPEGIPLISKETALNPRHSHTIGLALVRGIDTEKGILQLLTPIAPGKLEEINEKGGNIVLVSGKFDPASWAYTEDLYYKSRDEDTGETAELEQGASDIDSRDGEGAAFSVADIDTGNTDAVTTSIPWIEVLHAGQKRGVGSRIWKVRRDLGRSAGNGD